jgi:phosphatidylinositol alpha 1,6-mannosyltransferase
VSGDVLARWYATADIFVFPCAIETFGNAVLEAFASGLPVVGANQGAVPELVRHGWNGLLVPPGASLEFADAIGSLVRRPEERARLGAHGRETAARYRWSDINRQLLGYYEQVLGAAPDREPLGAAVAQV